jgi:hypothetical protein
MQVPVQPAARMMSELLPAGCAQVPEGIAFPGWLADNRIGKGTRINRREFSKSVLMAGMGVGA